MAHRLYKTALGGLVLTSLFLVAACSEGPGSAPADDPTLLGSWQRVDMEPDTIAVNGIDVQSAIITLTFTKSRFIKHTRVMLEDGTHAAIDPESGTWTSTDTTVTKIYHLLINDGSIINDEGIEVATYVPSEAAISVEKEYLWGDAERNTLSIHGWDEDEPVTSFEQYTRLEPLSGGITGVWHLDQGGNTTFTLTISDTSIEYIAIFAGQTFTITGDLKRHDLDEGFLFITVTDAEWPNAEVGHELKYAYAQTGPNSIAVSTPGVERVFDEDEMMWVDRTDPPYIVYGEYWLALERQQ